MYILFVENYNTVINTLYYYENGNGFDGNTNLKHSCRQAPQVT